MRLRDVDEQDGGDQQDADRVAEEREEARSWCWWWAVRDGEGHGGCGGEMDVQVVRWTGEHDEPSSIVDLVGFLNAEILQSIYFVLEARREEGGC